MEWPKSFENIMQNCAEGWPVFDDFKNKRVFFDIESIEVVESLLGAHRRVVIRGAEGRGKTVMARVVGFRKHNNNWKVRFVDASQIREYEIGILCDQIRNRGDSTTLYIVENAHSLSEVVTQNLVNVANEHPKASFIFTTRDVLLGDLLLLIPSPFEKWIESGWYLNLIPNLRVTYKIIQTFVSSEHLSNIVTQSDISWIGKEFGEIPVNLRRLNWYLETWRDTGGSLSAVTKEEVLMNIYNYYFQEIAKQGDSYEKEEIGDILLQIAGVFKFDVDFYGKDYSKEVLVKLIDKGIISRVGENFYRLAHSLDAAYIVETIAVRKKSDISAITVDILKKYLKSKPENYFSVLRALRINDERGVLANILEDHEVHNVVLDLFRRERIDVISKALRYIKWACGEATGLRYWNGYKRTLNFYPANQVSSIKEKLATEELNSIASLLSALSKLGVIDEEKELLDNILEITFLAKRAKEAKFTSIVNLIGYLPNEKSPDFIKSLNLQELAEKLTNEFNAGSSIQVVTWLLKNSSKNLEVLRYANIVLGLADKQAIVNRCMVSDYTTVYVVLSSIRRVNPSLFMELRESLSSNWLSMLLNSNLAEIVRRLGDSLQYPERWWFGNPRLAAETIVSSLAQIELGERIKELYHRPNIRPLRVLGKLLSFAIQVSSESDNQNLRKVTWEIANNINLSDQETINAEELSLLVSRVKISDELAHVKLCNRMITELNLLNYVASPLPKGLAVLIWHVYKCNEVKGHEIADAIVTLDLNKCLNDSDTEEVARMIWNLLQINEKKTIIWTESVLEKEWVPKVLSSSSKDEFWLLWSLYHAEEERVKRIVRNVARAILTKLDKKGICAEDLPLLGFFSFCGVQVELDIRSLTTSEIVTKASKQFGLSELAFAMHFLKDTDYQLANVAWKEFKKCLSSKGLEYPIENMLNNYPFEKTRKLLKDVLDNFKP